MLNSPVRRRARLAAVATLVLGLVLPAVVQQSAHAGLTSSTRTVRSDCPGVYPISRVHRGMDATGWTTSQGRTPRPFAVHVLGVMRDGIAPGIDLILIRADSPAIRAAGGLWAGVSGSPVYAADGRLIGSLSYGISYGPSRTAGLTPAAAMYQLFSLPPNAPAPAYRRHIALSPQLRHAAVRTGGAAPAAAAAGLDLLRTPVSVSGMPRSSFPAVRRALHRLGSTRFTLHTGGGVAPGTRAAPTSVHAGQPFAGAITTGDFTVAYMGAVTAVCNGRVLAFGHPILSSGPSELSANTASVIYIQRDTVQAPFAMWNVGGQVGRVDQDRLVGLRAQLGAAPVRHTEITADVASSTGLHVTTHTVAYPTDWVPDASASGVFATMQAALVSGGPGAAGITFDVAGHVVGGAAWQLQRGDQLSDRYGVGYAVGDLVWGTLRTIVDNPFRQIAVDSVTMHVNAHDGYRALSLAAVRQRVGATWQRLASGDVIRVSPGGTIRLQARLTAYQQATPDLFVPVVLHVPSTTPLGSGSLDVTGGADLASQQPAAEGAKSFAGLLARLQNAPRNASLVARLEVPGKSRSTVVRVSVHLPSKTTGSLSFQVRVRSLS